MISIALVDTISQIQNNLREGRIPNEAAVSQSVVLPILKSLEWPVFDPSVVIPQYQVAEHPERRVVDYALLKPDEHLAIFVEVRKVGGIDATGERQLFDYAFHTGVPLAVLTDGQEWNFYLPLEQGGYQDRQVYKFDLLNRDIEECSYRLHRYLFKGAVLEGSALENMRADLRDSARQGKIKETLPRAWESLISEADDSIVEALAKKVAKCAVTNLTQRFAPISFRTGLCLSNLPNPIVLGLSDNNRNVSPRRAQLFRKSASSCVVTTTHVPMLLG